MLDKKNKFYVREISVSYKMTDISLPENHVGCADDVAEIFKHLEDCNREKLCILHLSCRNKIIGFEVVSVGSVTASIVSIPEIFKSALLHNATGIVMVHNHPSGNPNPSKEDKLITTRVRLAAEKLEITLLDHIIIGENSHFSFADSGLI